MIRVREILERGRRHPVVGPLVLILLVLLLAMTFVHGAHDSEHMVVEFGGVCMALVTFLGVLLMRSISKALPRIVVASPGDRGPPSSTALMSFARLPVGRAPVSAPLRR